MFVKFWCVPSRHVCAVDGKALTIIDNFPPENLVLLAANVKKEDFDEKPKQCSLLLNLVPISLFFLFIAISRGGIHCHHHLKINLINVWYVPSLYKALQSPIYTSDNWIISKKMENRLSITFVADGEQIPIRIKKAEKDFHFLTLLCSFDSK